MNTRGDRRITVIGLVATALVLIGAAPAAAHILLDSAVPRGDGSVELTFTFDHSCDEAPTTSLEINLPEEAEVLDASGPDGWAATTSARRVEWSGPGIGDGAAARFTVVATLRGSIGQTLLFPAVQRCADGDGYTWDDLTESEERPAPRLVATAAVLSGVTAPAPGEPAGGGGGATATEAGAALLILGLLAFMLSPLVVRRGR